MGRARLTTHPAWCARGHRCNLGEHRSDPHRIDQDQMVLTRVQDRHGRQHAEVRIRVPLPADERLAVGQLARLVQLLRGLVPVLRQPGRKPLGR